MNSNSLAKVFALGNALLLTGSLLAQSTVDKTEVPTPLPPPGPIVALTQDWTPQGVELQAHNRDGYGSDFLGVILIGLADQTCSLLPEMPALLCDTHVLAAGFANGNLQQWPSQVPAGDADLRPGHRHRCHRDLRQHRYPARRRLMRQGQDGADHGAVTRFAPRYN